MNISGKTVVVTGAAGGIGKALAWRFLDGGARGVAIADLDGERVEGAGRELGCFARACDVTDPSDIERLVDAAEREFGPIDIFCSNAGILLRDPDPHNAAASPDSDWERSWAVNVMAHVYAARIMIPRMIAQGGGVFLQTVSAAGLLNQIGSAAYATTKHAAIGFAENLAITHFDDGIRVSVVCPQGVDTAMVRMEDKNHPALGDGILSPEAVANAAVAGLEAERFLILPHSQVLQYMQNKAMDYDRWIGGMVKLRRKAMAGGG